MMMPCLAAFSIIVIIAVVRIAIPVWVVIEKGISKKEISIVSEMFSVPRKVPSFAICEAMAGKTVPRKAMPGKAPGMAAASPEMAAASSTVPERGDRRERQNPRQNQTDR